MANKPYPLKNSSTFKDVALNGTKKRHSKWITLQLLPSGDSNNYYGVTASRKVGNAVTRNKLKRWARSCVRNEVWPEKYDSYIFVFVFKPQTEDKFFTKKRYSEFVDFYRKI